MIANEITTAYENVHRSSIITTKNNYFVVWFFYDNEPDYDWKRGSHGMYCDICKTLTSAKAKAKRYVNKDL